jgi:endoglucanase
MTDLLLFLKSLLSVSGLSAYETPAARLIEQEWRPLVDDLQRSRIGSLHGLKKGMGRLPRRSVMIAAHMDAIGLMASRIVDGFIYFTAVGDMDVRILPGTPVLVHTADGELPGVVAMPSPRLLPESQHGRFPDTEFLVVDTGLTPSQVSRRVQAGDIISINTRPMELSGGTLSGHSADNRASIAAVTVALQELQARSHAWDMWAVATVQEETTYAGATTSTFQLHPDLAVVLDVTFGKGPGAEGWNAFELGKGPTLATGPAMHPFLFEHFKKLSMQAGFSLPVEPIPNDSTTDTQVVQLTADGIPTMLLEIPLRYMHTPIELVALSDIQRAGRLLADFVVSLEDDFLERIEWA